MKLSSRVTTFLKTLALSVFILSLFRIIFFFSFLNTSPPFSTAEAFNAFFIGLRFDLRLSLLLTLPILLFSLFKKLHWSRARLSRKIWSLLYSSVFLTLFFTYAGDIGYYSYLHSRINSRIFEFMNNMLISLEMVYESYNVWMWSVGLFALTYLIYKIFFLFIFTSNGEIINKKKTKALQSVALTFAIILGLHSSVSQYPLRWSDAFFSQNSFISNLAMNPVHYIFDTLQYSKKNYDTEKVKKYYPVVAPYLGIQNLDQENLNFTRNIEQTPMFTSRPNIIYIIMESMAAYKTGIYGNHKDSSPEIDKLAKMGWNFRHFYTPTEGTARSIFCLVTGIPDINNSAKMTSSRNPLIVNQSTLINGLTGYKKYYFIGGNATWGNIRGLLNNNIEKLNLFEGDYMDGPRTDVWGLSDLDLFRQVAKKLSSQENSEPFFAAIQTASYHRPYTIPDDHGDFELKTLTDEELSKYGFSSNEEYNSFRLSDYSLGEFFNLIKDQPFFKNTIFVIHGDHGLPNNGAQNLTDGYKFHNLNRYQTPLVIYSPLISEPKEFSTITTEQDILPTILGITGHDYPNKAMGRNVLAIKNSAKRYSFSYVYYTAPLEIVLYDDQYLAVGTENGIQSLYLYNSDAPQKDIKNEEKEKFKEMSELLIGLFETSKYVLHHNKRSN